MPCRGTWDSAVPRMLRLVFRGDQDAKRGVVVPGNRSPFDGQRWSFPGTLREDGESSQDHDLSGFFGPSPLDASNLPKAGRRRFDPGRPLSKNPLCRKGFFTFGIGTPCRLTGRAPAAPAEHRCTTIARGVTDGFAHAPGAKGATSRP